MKTKIEATQIKAGSFGAEVMVLGLGLRLTVTKNGFPSVTGADSIKNIVNSHDELVRALENILTAADIIDDSQEPLGQNDAEYLLAICRQSRAALQRVKGGE